MILNEIAIQLDLAAKNAKAIVQISQSKNISEEQAYEIQRLSLEERYARGEKFVGLKLGFTSFAKMEQMGVHDMIWGRLTDSMLIENGGKAALSKYIHPRAEPEICFRISKDIDGEIDLKDLDEYVDGI